MSLTYEKYSDQSIVVRGDKIESPRFRKELSNRIIGKQIVNNRLKGGKGILITNNENNLKVLHAYAQELKSEIKPVLQDSKSTQDCKLEQVIKSELDDNKKENLDEKLDKDENFKLMNKSTEELKNVIEQEKKSGFKLNDVKSGKRNFDSESEDSEHEFAKKINKRSKERNTKKYDSSSESSSESDDYKRKSSKHRSSKDKRKYATPKSSKSYKHKRRYSYSSASSSPSSSDSEDERVQKTIKRKSSNKRDNPKIEIANEIIDSDEEDIVSLARRLRYLLRKVK